jgi:type IV pilus secretin PilQ/predicted competence protein
MRQQLRPAVISRTGAWHLAIIVSLALGSSLSLSAGALPIRLLGVSAQGNAILIESTEPAAYVVKRPDPLTVIVELRSVSLASPVTPVLHQREGDPIASLTLEQGVNDDGQAVARVRVELSRPQEYAVRSARNTIRLELIAPTHAVAPDPAPQLPIAPGRTSMPLSPAATDAPAATILDRVRSRYTPGATTITLGGNGRLTPADVTEAAGAPRRLVLDFPNVTSNAPAQVSVEGPLVKRVRVSLNSRTPLVTRVVMEVAEGATYHVERSGTGGSDLAVIFEAPQKSSTVLLTEVPAGTKVVDPEPDIPLEQAIANAAAITPKDTPAEAPPVAVPAVAKTAPPPQSATARQQPAPAAAAAERQPPPVAASVAAERQPTPAAAPATAARQQTPPVAPPLSVPTQTAPRPNQQIITGTGEKQYKGTPITLDFSGADLRSVLRYFNEISGLNIIIDPSVPATPIDVVLRDVPWDQAFETLLKTHKLGYVAEGTIVRIAPLSVLAEEEGDRRKLAEAKALAGDLRVQTFSLSYAKAGDVSPLLVKSALSQRGQIQVDARTNTIIVTDLPDRLQTVSALLGALDRPEPQVEVEARVVQTTREFAKAIGVQWGLNGRVTPGIGNTTGLAFPNNGTLNGRTGANNSPSDNRATANDTTATVVNLPVPGATSAIGLAVGAVNGAFNIDVALSALERSGKGRILSTPRLTTQNNVAAEVTQGLQIPIQTVANNTVTVSFKDAALTLQVTPQITSANTVIMQITLENATPDFSRQVNGIPPIDTQRARTQVQVDDGATTIIGGIFVTREQVSNERTPGLYRLPLLGWLFKRDTTSDESRELLIFITPRIIRG